MSAAPPVLLLGDPRLRVVAEPVKDIAAPGVVRDATRLHAALAAFRETHGFGRGIAAPQIGVSLRMVALDLGDGPVTMLNPRITWRGEERMTLWDDCMSFPWLLVRLERDASITVEFIDGAGDTQRWERLDRATSELLQHEIDHLDGILAIDHATDRDAVISREAFDADPDSFNARVSFPR